MDVIICTTVRHMSEQAIASRRPMDPDTVLDFLSDENRLNVAMTRARRALWLVGHVATLSVQLQTASHVVGTGWNTLLVAREITTGIECRKGMTDLPGVMYT